MVTIAVANQKGGVGKTTAVLNLSYAFSKLNKKVLAIDFDPQASLTLSLGYNPDEIEKTVYNLIAEVAKPEDVILKTKYDFDLIPSNIDLAAAEVVFVSKIGREKLLRKAINNLNYDIILIDCQPSLGLLTVNALVAADYVLIPVSTQFLSLKGMDLLFQTIKEVRENVNPDLKILGILPTFYDQRTKHSKEMLKKIKEEFRDYIVFNPIKRSVKIDDSLYQNKPIFFMEDKTSKKIAEDYMKVAIKILEVIP